MMNFMILYILLIGVASWGGAMISIPCALYTFAIGIISGGAFYAFTRKRYETISILNSQLNNILHGDYSMEMIHNQEGELAVLSNEIYKMTIMLREQSELLQKDKTYLSDSIADISHQLRTPLTSIRMLMLRLQRNHLTPTEKTQLIQEINSLLSRIEWLITALLKISQLESGTALFQHETIHVNKLMAQSLESLEIPLELRDIMVENLIPSDICYVGDFFWTSEALGNILKNSMEHTPYGGKITIEAEENPIYTEIIISDTGNGFLPEDIPHLFERFYKGNDSGKNNIGIGLALAHMIITKQNGTLTASNRNNSGAEFRIRFFKGAL